jgi:hypothetical protein
VPRLLYEEAIGYTPPIDAKPADTMTL